MKKILIVEDDNSLRAILSEKLTRTHNVLQAEDGEEAINSWLDKRPDLVLLDLLLPKIDGIKVLERMRSYPDEAISRTPVIVFSNLWSNKDILRVQGLKIEEYFIKANTKIEDVIKRIDEVFVIKKTEQK